MKRLKNLDIAKAISIIAVVFSHELSSIKPLIFFLDSFMLPTFFFIAGIFIDVNKYNLNIFIRRRWQSLMKPYIYLGGIVSLITMIINKSIYTVISSIISNFFSWQTLWFLPILFIANILSYIFAGYLKSTALKTLLLFLFGATGSLLSFYSIHIPMALETVFIAVFYVGLGVMANHYIHVCTLYGNLFPIFLLVNLFVLPLYGTVFDIHSNQVNPLYIKIFGSFCGITWILQFSSYLEKIKEKSSFLQKILKGVYYIGENTLVILAFHMPIFFTLQLYIRPLFVNQVIYKIIEFLLIWIGVFLISYLINKYAPSLIGKNRLKIQIK